MATTAARDRVHSGKDASTSANSNLVARVKQRYPFREEIIDVLAADLLRQSSLGVNCLLYGPPATGKTAVARVLLTVLGVRHAYINCNEASRPRSLLCSVLHQLKGGKRQRDEGYDCGIKCDTIQDFRLQLPGVVGRRRGPCWLVLDNVHRIGGTDLLSALMRVREDTGADLALLLIGHAGWGSGRYLRDTATAVPPKETFFPCYMPDQLQKILEQQRQLEMGSTGDAPAYAQFLTAFVPAFCRASNNLLNLQAAVRRLFPLYMQPLREGRQLQARQLYAHILGEVQQCIQVLQLQGGSGGGSSHLLAAPATAADREGPAGEQGTAAGRKASSSGLAFELPYISKFLLLAAYIASRNKPTSDRAVFDPTHRKRGRKDAQAHDRQVEAAVDAKLRGPHSFPLERLLHIFYAIYAHSDAEDEEEEGDEEEEAQRKAEAQRVMQQAEVLQQVSSLVALRLMDQSSGDVLEGQAYRCLIPEDVAAALAANVRLRLTDYLRLG